jgi:hypothetical protein
LSHAERRIGVDFDNDEALWRELSDPTTSPLLLFPGPTARSLERAPRSPRATLVVIDGTWWQARKLLKLNPRLAALPRYALEPAQPSQYRIRRAPAPNCISTIEAIADALGVLEGQAANRDEILRPFFTLVEQQVAFATERGARRHRVRPRRPRAPVLPERLAQRDGLLVAYGEANAWPRNSDLGSTPEIVHWSAYRVSTGEHFEALIAPRLPLSPSFTLHTQVPQAAVLRGSSWEAFIDRWGAFVRPDDVICSWGHYAVDVLAREGAPLPERFDLRELATRYLRRKPGDVHTCSGHLGVEPIAPWALGRTGRRLASLGAVCEGLIEAATKQGSDQLAR